MARGGANMTKPNENGPGRGNPAFRKAPVDPGVVVEITLYASEAAKLRKLMAPGTEIGSYIEMITRAYLRRPATAMSPVADMSGTPERLLVHISKDLHKIIERYGESELIGNAVSWRCATRKPVVR